MTGKENVGACIFCGGEFIFSYKWAEYEIWKCSGCGTGRTAPMPSMDILKKFYDGFLFQGNEQFYEQIKSSFLEFLQYLQFPTGGSRMLDIGGGGGFYASAFEQLRYGEACYIDLDVKACEHARSKLKNVTCGDAADEVNIDGKFDLIFARHLIEHLIDPVTFIDKVFRYLTDTGKLVLIFPNARTLEYHSIIPYTLKRVKMVLRSNGWNPRAALRVVGSDIHHDIDPVRHLWAITEEGIRAVCEKRGYKCRIETFRLDELMVSPYYNFSDNNTFLHRTLGRKLATIAGGAHLMCILEKKN